MFNIGMLELLDLNYKEAKKWVTLAGENGCSRAAEVLEYFNLNSEDPKLHIEVLFNPFLFCCFILVSNLYM